MALMKKLFFLFILKLFSSARSCVFTNTECQCSLNAGGSLCLRYLSGVEPNLLCEAYVCGSGYVCDCSGSDLCDINACSGDYYHSDQTISNVGDIVSCERNPKVSCVSLRVGASIVSSPSQSASIPPSSSLMYSPSSSPTTSSSSLATSQPSLSTTPSPLSSLSNTPSPSSSPLGSSSPAASSTTSPSVTSTPTSSISSTPSVSSTTSPSQSTASVPSSSSSFTPSVSVSPSTTPSSTASTSSIPTPTSSSSPSATSSSIPSTTPSSSTSSIPSASSTSTATPTPSTSIVPIEIGQACGPGDVCVSGAGCNCHGQCSKIITIDIEGYGDDHVVPFVCGTQIGTPTPAFDVKYTGSYTGPCTNYIFYRVLNDHGATGLIMSGTLDNGRVVDTYKTFRSGAVTWEPPNTDFLTDGPFVSFTAQGWNLPQHGTYLYQTANNYNFHRFLFRNSDIWSNNIETPAPSTSWYVVEGYLCD